MGLLFIAPIIILLVGALVTDISYKRMVKNGVSRPGLWAVLVFVGIVALACIACFVAFLANFQR